MRIILAAVDYRLIVSWKEFFETETSVTIIEADITQILCDAIVSPANSFGFMDGGLD